MNTLLPDLMKLRDAIMLELNATASAQMRRSRVFLTRGRLRELFSLVFLPIYSPRPRYFHISKNCGAKESLDRMTVRN
jgi:hypothetical protein